MAILAIEVSTNSRYIADTKYVGQEPIKSFTIGSNYTTNAWTGTTIDVQ